MIKTEEAAMALLRSALRPVASIEKQINQRSGRADLTIKLPRGIARVELKQWGHPSTREMSGDRIIVWILERAHADLRQRLREENANFVDLTGAVRLQIQGILIDRDDLEPIPTGDAPETRNPFADRASRIGRTLFDSPTRSWPVHELSHAAGVSMGTTSYVVNALAERKLVTIEMKSREKRVRLVDRHALISQWTAEYTWRLNRAVSFDAPVGSAEKFLDRLPRILTNVTWALTVQAGASLIQRHARWDTVHIYVDASDLETEGLKAGWTPSPTGKVVLFAPYYKDSAWFGLRQIKRIPVVSNLQLILDLWHYPVRGREQAEMLTEYENRFNP